MFGRSYDRSRYDNEQVEYLFNKIMEIPEHDRVFHYKNKMINLTSFQDSADQDFFEGTFISARFGQKQEIIDVYTQTKAGDKERDHGVKNEVHFLLDKRNGLLLTHYDNQAVVGRNMLHRFFTNHAKIAEGYRQTFNRKNEEATILKSAYLKVVSLPSKEFLEEIDRFVRVKEAFMIADKESSLNNEGIEALTGAFEDGGVDDYQQIKIVLRNTLKRGSIKHIKAFFEQLAESNKYDNYGVSGTTSAGSYKTISMASVPQSFDAEITFNENGLPSESELINEMVRIAKTDNPILEKNAGMKQIKEVGDLSDISEEAGEDGESFTQ